MIQNVSNFFQFNNSLYIKKWLFLQESFDDLMMNDDGRLFQQNFGIFPNMK